MYRNVKANYLYYWPATNQWAIGADYTSDATGARSTGSVPAVCPDGAMQWQVYFNGAWVSPGSASSNLVFVGAESHRGLSLPVGAHR